MTDSPRPSPHPPDDAAPLAHDKTPAYGLVTAEYVKRKLAENGRAPVFVPSKRTPLWAAVFVGVVGSSAPALMFALPAPWNYVVGSALIGAAGSLATFFGMRSAGVQK